MVAEEVAEGVPLIKPVLELMLKPAGRVGEIVYTSVPVPLLPVTGVKLAAAWFCVNTVEATAFVATTAALTVSEKFAIAVALFASVTVTV